MIVLFYFSRFFLVWWKLFACARLAIKCIEAVLRNSLKIAHLHNVYCIGRKEGGTAQARIRAGNYFSPCPSQNRTWKQHPNTSYFCYLILNLVIHLLNIPLQWFLDPCQQGLSWQFLHCIFQKYSSLDRKHQLLPPESKKILCDTQQIVFSFLKWDTLATYRDTNRSSYFFLSLFRNYQNWRLNTNS